MTPTREGYIFTEWSIDNDKAKINNNIFIMKDSDTKITANWKKSEIEPYLITDISIDGTTIDNFDTNNLEEIQNNLKDEYSRILITREKRLKPLFIIYFSLTVISIVVDILFFSKNKISFFNKFGM